MLHVRTFPCRPLAPPPPPQPVPRPVDLFSEYEQYDAACLRYLQLVFSLRIERHDAISIMRVKDAARELLRLRVLRWAQSE
jgi:hypothetical protein